MLSARSSRPFLFALTSFACVSASITFQRRHGESDGIASSTHPGPLLLLNETEVLHHHAPDPLSYYLHDFDSDASSTNVRGLMALHVFGMSIAFFLLLPVGIAFRSVRHSWHSAVVVSFCVVAFLSSAAGSLYRKLTGNLYQGSIHGPYGYGVLALVSLLALCDAFTLFCRIAVFLKSADRKNIHLFWRNVLLNQNQNEYLTNECDSLMREESSSEEYNDSETKAVAHDEGPNEPRGSHRKRFNGTIDTSHGHTSEWVNQQEWPQSASSHRTLVNHSYHASRHSDASDYTLQGVTFSRFESHDNQDHHGRRPRLATIRSLSFATAERVLIILAFMQLVSGITVYTGICRGNYINGCMAHLIKGGIFWCYGLLSFGRYLGAWADLGWAWNRLPARRLPNIPTAEMVECFVIFLYGATNTWMERFGAAPGSPYTTKQVQHISIAVMFWFAGMIGMALELKVFRHWLAAAALSVVKPDEAKVQPPSYMGSFNPFPALVIGVTGAAMSAHHQTYLFQVQIHALWGFLLTAFALMRFFTYFFLWLRPPHSVLPSRPPTEALASFFLTTGGLVFILSTEQITFAAMRRGHDDVMFFFNFAVAATCLAFCWVLSTTAFKGWVKSRAAAAHPAQSPSFSRRVLFDSDVRTA